MNTQLEQLILDMRDRLTELERRNGGRNRTGVIAEVDAANGLARVKLLDDDDGEPFLTDWLPWMELSAGKNKTHSPPSQGQQVQVSSETGDLHDGVIQGSLNSDDNGRPSGAGDEYVLLSVGAAKITATGGGSEIKISVGGYSVTFSASGATHSGGKLTHNGKDVGATHTHGGVIKGVANTKPPN